MKIKKLLLSIPQVHPHRIADAKVIMECCKEGSTQYMVCDALIALSQAIEDYCKSIDYHMGDSEDQTGPDSN